MGRRALPAKMNKLVWRMTVSVPEGARVDPDVASVPSPDVDDPPESLSSGWFLSSSELSGGSEVRSGSEALSDELFAEWFAPENDDRKSSGKK